MGDFLPDEYTEPIVSKYMKFEEGENRIRILPAKPGRPAVIMGWEYWKTVDGKRKPVRIPKDQTVPMGELERNPKTGELEYPMFFWALTVWNYDAEAIQILEITQKTVRQPIEGYSKNPKWGSPMDYDIIVTQVVDGSRTSYSVAPDPKSALDPKIQQMYDAMPLNLEALYAGEDPFRFDADQSSTTITPVPTNPTVLPV